MKGLLPLSPFSPTEAAYQGLAELRNRVWPDQPTCAAWLERVDRERDPARPWGRVVATDPRDPARIVGMGEWSFHRFSLDPRRFEISVEVDPEWRRGGLGSRLFQWTTAAMPIAGHHLLECCTGENHPEAVAFLRRRGFSLHERSAESELDLAGFDAGRFSATVGRVEASGLELVDLGGGRCEDERLLRAILALQAGAQRDVPGDDGFELAPFDHWRRSYGDNPDLLPEAHLVARDGAEVVGMTQLWASQATDALLYTGFTGVARSHRRRGIATALKVRSLGWAKTLTTSAGFAPRVRTSNAESNPMLELNRALGFVARPARLRMAAVFS